MTQHNLTQILKVIRDFVMRNRPCYRDYLGSETVTKTMQIGSSVFVDHKGIAETGFLVTDSAFAGFILGETYTVSIDGVTADYVARNLSPISDEVGPVIGTVTTFDMENHTFDGWICAAYRNPDEKVACQAQTFDMSFVGKTISISQTRTETVKRYNTKLLPEYLLPAFLRKNVVASKTEVQKAQATADNTQATANNASNAAQVALNAADNAQTKASTALTRANNAQAAANAAQSVANTALERVVEPDWNQNDATQPDYVKNRPFYTGNPVETVLVEESTINFFDDNGLYFAEFPSTFEATVGETYKVSWDSTVYECTCVDFNGVLYMGNMSIDDIGPDTGEPFLMIVSNGEGIEIVTTDTSASHTFSISCTEAPIVKIPAKYIDKNNSGYVVIHSKGTMTQQEAENYGTAISTKEVVFIIWGGMCISDISFQGTAGSVLKLTTQNGEYYIITKNSNGLFNLSDMSFDKAILPNSAVDGDNHIGIDVHNNKVIISKSTTFSVVGSTNVLFQVQPDGTKSKSFDVLGNGEVVTPALILYSSTADSTKKFRITVDDTGTLKATEVT